MLVALYRGLRCGTRRSLVYLRTELGMIPDIVALYGFRFSMALWIRSFETLLKVHLRGGYQKSSSGGVRFRLVVGKNVACRRLLFSLLLCASLTVHFVAGSITCKVGIWALAASVDGEEMNLAACHMLDSSRPSSQSIQWSALAFFMWSKYLFSWRW